MREAPGKGLVDQGSKATVIIHGAVDDITVEVVRRAAATRAEPSSRSPAWRDGASLSGQDDAPQPLQLAEER